MPITPTYPGVYIEEIPSGVRTITGVATSITAFIGRAARGPTDEPVTITNFGDYERIFGGLSLLSTMSFAVRDFYLNGGSQAIIVRLFREGEAPSLPSLPLSALAPPGVAVITLPAPAGQTFELQAANPGKWGRLLGAVVDNKTKNTADAQLFNLTISEWDEQKKTILNSERFLNVSVDINNPRFITRVLKDSSSLVQVNGTATPSAAPNVNALDSKGQPIPVFPDEVNEGNDGLAVTAQEFIKPGNQNGKLGLYSLEKADLFNLLCIPPYEFETDIDYSLLVPEALEYCKKRRAMMLLDPPRKWTDKTKALAGIVGDVGDPDDYAAVFFPRLKQSNPLKDRQVEEFVPCGAVAGVFARTDTNRGVWKAPAGLDATLVGVPQLSVPLTDAENGQLNPKGINCLRAMPPGGRVIWGSRTRRGDDILASEWKYIPVRRTALFIEESLFRGTQWVVFEPNDEPLWSQIRLNVGAFMHNLFRQGAFQGTTPREAYFVKCDKETTTQNDINLGIVNVLVGFAPLKPAEFVIIKIQQIAGQIDLRRSA